MTTPRDNATFKTDLASCMADAVTGLSDSSPAGTRVLVCTTAADFEKYAGVNLQYATNRVPAQPNPLTTRYKEGSQYGYSTTDVIILKQGDSYIFVGRVPV